MCYYRENGCGNTPQYARGNQASSRRHAKEWRTYSGTSGNYGRICRRERVDQENQPTYLYIEETQFVAIVKNDTQNSTDTPDFTRSDARIRALLDHMQELSALGAL